MPLHQLTLASLMEQLDGGRVGAAFDAELKRIALDCEDRPTDTKPRKVILSAEIVPVEQDGLCEEVRVKFQATSTVPKRRSKPYSMALRKGGMLVFNDLSEDDINQGTIE